MLKKSQNVVQYSSHYYFYPLSSMFRVIKDEKREEVVRIKVDTGRQTDVVNNRFLEETQVETLNETMRARQSRRE